MAGAVPMPGDPVPEVDVLRGFTWRHGGYDKKNEQMEGTRIFHPPGTIE